MPMKALLAVVALTGIASADDDAEPAVAQAGDANLEPTATRQGIQLTGALGGGLAIGFSVPDANGTGGRFSFRLGEPMTPSWLLTVELAGGAQLHRSADHMQTYVDNDANVLIGAQYYPSDSFFVRAGLGIGTYMQTTAARDLANHKYAGPAFVFGGGLELVRVKHLVFDVELFSISMANREGLLATTALCVGATLH